MPAVDGSTLVTTIDANIQAICEKYIRQFNDEHLNEAREGLGAYNIGVIIQDCTNGDVKAMASYPDFDLNNPRDISAYYSEEEIAELQSDEKAYYKVLNELWRNFAYPILMNRDLRRRQLRWLRELRQGEFLEMNHIHVAVH